MSTLIGRFFNSSEPAVIGDMERRKGTYAVGESGTGKSSLIIRMMESDVRNGHGVFFLDPNGDAIKDFTKRCDLAGREGDIILLDPEKEDQSFAINLLECRDVESAKERQDTYNRAYKVFHELWQKDKDFGVYLQSSIRHILNTFIENQGLTLAELPLFLFNKEFRNALIANVTRNRVTAEFWRSEFGTKPSRDQEAYLRPFQIRVNELLANRYFEHIVGQARTTIDFPEIIRTNKIVLVRFSDNLSIDIKRPIGSILVSEIINAVKKRGELEQSERHQFCIFIDEVQNFTNHADISWLFTQARKAGVATTIVHQERYGQFAENKQMLGATDQAGNKVCFCLSPRDAQEQAIEFERPPPVETRRERQLVLSREPVADLLRGHIDADILGFVDTYLRPLQEMREDTTADMERIRLERLEDIDEAGLGRIEASLERAESYTNISYGTIKGALGAAAYAQRQAREKTVRLLSLFARSNDMRLSVRGFNKFLTAVMEGSIAPGQESFSSFLIQRVGESVYFGDSKKEVVSLYIQLSFGDPQVTRHMPVWLAKKHGLLQKRVEGVEQDAMERAKRKKEHSIETSWATFHGMWKGEFERRREKRENRIGENRKGRKEGSFSFRGFGRSRHDLEGLLRRFIAILEYPDIRRLLEPYFTAR